MTDFTPDRRHILTAAALTGLASLGGTRIWAADTKAATPDLTGQSILITGTSSGFGRLGAEHFARLGAKVFASMRNVPRDEAKDLEALAKSDDLDITVVEIDVTSNAQVERGVAEVLKATGGTLDALINNAGIGLTGPLEVQDMEATTLMYETNTFGPHRMSRAVLPAMRAQGSGHIINVSSQLGRVMIPFSGHYSGTKFALEAASEQLAYELVPHNIGVTIIQPGGYPTQIWQNRNVLSNDLKSRLSDERKAAYPDAVERMGGGTGGGSTDPMDVPRAMAEVLAEPLSSRPLRVAVHPGNKPQIPVNKASAKAQLDWLGESGHGPVIKAVQKRG